MIDKQLEKRVCALEGCTNTFSVYPATHPQRYCSGTCEIANIRDPKLRQRIGVAFRSDARRIINRFNKQVRIVKCKEKKK